MPVSRRPYVGCLRHPAAPTCTVPWPSFHHTGAALVTMKLSDTAEAASSDTLAALAQVIRALAPEVCSVSFHDLAAETLWLSEDFLTPEDHQLVEESLYGTSTGDEMSYGADDGERSS